MKIAVVGCGALGGFYGAKLCRAGETVHCLLRSDYETVRRQGLFIHSPQGDFHVHPKCAQAPQDIGVSDLVLIGLKTTANDQFPRLLPPLVGPATILLTLQNGLGNEERLAELFGGERVIGGLCVVCLNRTAPGVVQHVDHGQVVLGEFQRPPEPRTHEMAALLRRAGVPCQVTADLERAHWEKLAWNIPFNGLGVAGAAGYDAVRRGKIDASAPLGPCVTTDQLLSDPRWEKLVRELMEEVIRAGCGQGLKLSPDLAEQQIARTRTIGAYRASTLIDFEQGKPLELQSLFLEPLRRAQRAGVDTPRLAALCAVLGQLSEMGSCYPKRS